MWGPFSLSWRWFFSDLCQVAQLDRPADTAGQFDQVKPDPRSGVRAKTPDRPYRPHAEDRPDIADGNRRGHTGDAKVDLLIAIGEATLDDTGEIRAQLGFGGLGVIGIGLEAARDDAFLKFRLGEGRDCL